MTKMYYDQDANLDLLSGKTVAIIGFGSQGHAQAQNLRDSGVNVIISELAGTPNYDLAKSVGFEPLSAGEAAEKADIIQVLIPDEVQAKVYKAGLHSHEAGKALVFSMVSTSTSARSYLLKKLMCSWVTLKDPDTLCGECMSRVQAYHVCLQSTKMHQAKLKILP